MVTEKKMYKNTQYSINKSKRNMEKSTLEKELKLYYQ